MKQISDYEMAYHRADLKRNNERPNDHLKSSNVILQDFS